MEDMLTYQNKHHFYYNFIFDDFASHISPFDDIIISFYTQLTEYTKSNQLILNYHLSYFWILVPFFFLINYFIFFGKFHLENMCHLLRQLIKDKKTLLVWVSPVTMAAL